MCRLMKMCRASAVIFLFIVVSTVKCQTSVNRLSKAITPTIYDLHISIDLDNLKFTGDETIHVHANEASSTIELHVLDLLISDVQVLDGVEQISILSTSYVNATQIFRITLFQSLNADSDYLIKMSFEGEIKDDMKGLYRSSYYESGTAKFMATTFSAAAYTRKIFPCFDEPAFKAIFRLSISNRNNFVTLANTKISKFETTELENGEIWRKTEFEPTPVMSTYLLAFAVSEFTNITSIDEYEFSVYSSRKAISSMQYALDIGREALKSLEDYVGHTYTLEKMDFIAIDDFLMGAMENWGLVSFKSSRIMNPQNGRNLRVVQQITNIVAHELVHMFFGNQVTCEYWDFVWLNEGFASYLEYVVADKILPTSRLLDYFVVNRMHSVMLQDVPPKTHAMTRTVNTPEEISNIYDFVAYPKAASVIRMVEHIMTPEIFRKALSVYIDERSYKSATDEQLFEVLERVRRENSAADYPSIPEIFRSWANFPGFPILNVEFFNDNNTAKVRQELFVPSINSTDNSAFHILFNYIGSSSKDFNETSPLMWLQGTEVDFALNGLSNNESWIIFNIQQTGYYRVNYDERNWRSLIDELHGESFNSIHILNRAQMLDDSFNLARCDYLDFSITLELIKYLHHETELIPLIAGFKSIEFLLTFLDQQEFYEDLRDILLSIVDEVYVRINSALLQAEPEDEHNHVLTKLHVNMFACQVGASSCLKDATRKLFLFDYEFSTLDINERPYLYCGILGEDLANNHWAQFKLILLKANGNEEIYRDNQEEFNEIFGAFSTCDRNLERVESLLHDIFNSSNDTENYENVTTDNALQVVRNLIKTSSTHRALMMKFFSENYDAVNEKAPFKETLSTFAEAINTKAHLESFISLASVSGMNLENYEKTITEIEENIHWLEKKAPEIAKWVANEKGASMSLKVSILTVITFIFVMVF